MRHAVARFGVALSIVAAASILAHMGVDHGAAAKESAHACGICRVASVDVESPSLKVAPAAFSSEDLAAAAAAPFNASSYSFLTGRGPPTL